jgi:hypothetical protein
MTFITYNVHTIMAYFFNSNGKLGSDKMRCTHIIDYLNVKQIDTTVISQSTTDFFNKIKDIKKKYMFWIKKFQEHAVRITKLNENYNVFDCVDNYVYNKQKILSCITSSLFDLIIVNNIYMKNEIKKLNNLQNVIVIYHHYDPIYKTIPIKEPDIFTFGYMGSLASLNHSENFRFYRELANEFNIVFLDTEDGEYYSSQHLPINGKQQGYLNNIEIRFHCHISIRKLNSDLSKYKTSAKLATACAFNQNIITTNEECIKDLLPIDYPFILLNDDLDSIRILMHEIVNDYNNSKILWNKGLQIINDIKHHLDLDECIGKRYEGIISDNI